MLHPYLNNLVWAIEFTKWILQTCAEAGADRIEWNVGEDQESVCLIHTPLRSERIRLHAVWTNPRPPEKDPFFDVGVLFLAEFDQADACLRLSFCRDPESGRLYASYRYGSVLTQHPDGGKLIADLRHHCWSSEEPCRQPGEDAQDMLADEQGRVSIQRIIQFALTLQGPTAP